MPNTESNGGLSLEALLAAAQTARGDEVAPEEAPAAPSGRAVSPGSDGTEGGSARAAATADTASAEPAAEPSAAVQQEATEKAEPAFDLAAALGYGSRSDGGAAAASSGASPSEEKFDLAAALGYKSAEVQKREAAEAVQAEAQAQAQAAHAEAQTQAQAVQDRAMREAQQQARLRERQATREEKKAAEGAGRLASGEDRRDTAPVRGAAQERSDRTDAAQRMADRRAERQLTARPTSGLGAQSMADAGGKNIESYQPTKRDRSAQARAARPLKQEEVSEVAQAIAAETARTEYVEEPAAVVKEETVEAVAVTKAQSEDAGAGSGAKPAEERFTRTSDQPAAPLGEPVVLPEPEQPMPEPAPEPAPVVEQPASSPTPASEPVPVPVPMPSQSMTPQPNLVDFTSPEFASAIATGAPEPPRAMPAGSKPAPMPHKVPVRTTEEIIKPVSAPVKLGVISPEAARHEAEAKKKVQSNERKIVKRVRRFRALGMFLIVVALAALAGAIFLFVAGNAQANESIEAAATEICEEAGRTITYRYKAADSNGTLCPTTEVATFSAGDVLEQSVITMNTPDFETAAHTLANFKKQFQDSSYVDGRVDGSTVIFTLHMSNERIMKVTYTALLMTNTTGCEVILN